MDRTGIIVTCQNHMSMDMCLTHKTRSAMGPEYLLNIINMLHKLITLSVNCCSIQSFMGFFLHQLTASFKFDQVLENRSQMASDLSLYIYLYIFQYDMRPKKLGVSVLPLINTGSTINNRTSFLYFLCPVKWNGNRNDF